MNKETYLSLLNIMGAAKKTAKEMQKHKRKYCVFDTACLIRDIQQVNDWISEVEKEH